MQPLVQPRPPADSPLIERLVTSPLVRSGYLSLALHLLLALAVAWLAVEGPRPRRPQPLEISMGEAAPNAAADDPLATLEIGPAGEPAAADGAFAPPLAAVTPPLEPLATDALVADEPLVPVVPLPIMDSEADVFRPSAVAAGAAATQVSARVGDQHGPPSVRRPTRPVAAAGRGTGDPFAARRGAGRAAAARGRGGNAASEAAVERGLAWLALHQAVDGSWQFDLSGCRCDGGCRDPGTLTSSTASTAIALLPFLGAGHTHLDGSYQETVSRGIYYLLSRMASTPRGADFSEGTMYGHGVSTLVLAESLGMTRDDMLERPVREALRFIETSQDLHGGGWRYLPGQAGDITVTAWQLAALKSGQMAGFAPSSPTIDGVCRFLDRVQTQNGAAYGYRTPAAKPCTSAIGLLCRLYTGWSAEQEPLARGLTALAKSGPAPTAIYENFYLAQALLLSGHPVWPRWNIRQRDQLVALQSRQAHEAGSWFVGDRDTAPGGRLAHTCLAILTLEVYYRLLPIYQAEATESPF